MGERAVSGLVFGNGRHRWWDGAITRHGVYRRSRSYSPGVVERGVSVGKQRRSRSPARAFSALRDRVPLLLPSFSSPPCFPKPSLLSRLSLFAFTHHSSASFYSRPLSRDLFWTKRVHRQPSLRGHPSTPYPLTLSVSRFICLESVAFIVRSYEGEWLHGRGRRTFRDPASLMAIVAHVTSIGIPRSKNFRYFSSTSKIIAAKYRTCVSLGKLEIAKPRSPFPSDSPSNSE